MLVCSALFGARSPAPQKSPAVLWCREYTKVIVHATHRIFETLMYLSKVNTMSMHTSRKSAFQLPSFIRAISTKIWFFVTMFTTTKRPKSLSSANLSLRKIRNVCSCTILFQKYPFNTILVAMLYVQKDLSAVTKAVFDNWDAKRDELNHKILYVANARVSPAEIIACIKKGIFISHLPRIFEVLIRR